MALESGEASMPHLSRGKISLFWYNFFVRANYKRHEIKNRSEGFPLPFC